MNRRQFVNRMAVGSGAAAIGGVLVFQGSSMAQTAGDPIRGEIERQLRQLVPEMRKGGHAAARQAASLLNVWSVHARTLDAPLKTALGKAVKEHGRSAFLLNKLASHERMAAELAKYGIPHDRIPTTDSAAKERAVDALLSGGLSQHLARVAEAMESAARLIEARGPVTRVALRQLNEDVCQTLWGYVEAAEAAVAVTCGLFAAAPNPVTQAACAAALGALAGLLGMYFTVCFIWG